MLLLMILTFFLNCSDAEKTKEVESKAWRDILHCQSCNYCINKMPNLFNLELNLCHSMDWIPSCFLPPDK